MPVDGVVTVPGWSTPTKVRILAGSPTGIKQQVVRYDREPDGAVPEPARAVLAARLAAATGRARVAVLSDYGYGAAVPEVPAARAAVGAAGVVIADSRYRLGEFRGLTGATPNQEEAEALAGQRLAEGGAALAAGGERLRSALGASHSRLRLAPAALVRREWKEVSISCWAVIAIASMIGIAVFVLGGVVMAVLR